MVRITIDKATQEKLLSSGEIVELVDESGQLLARVLPHREAREESRASITPEYSEEELDLLSAQAARAGAEGGITTEELLARLRAKR